MIDLGELVLTRPMALLALPVLGVAGLLISRRPAGLGDWSAAVDPELLEAMRRLGRLDGHASRVRAGLTLAAAALVVLGIAGPAVERRDAPTFRSPDAVILVVDVSPSSVEGDGWPDRVTAARMAVAEMCVRPGGLVVYAGDAYPATAPTTDTSQIGLDLALLDGETVPNPGSRPERGLIIARELLESRAIDRGDVVLFTDGGGVGPEAIAAAESIARQGATFSVVAPLPTAGDRVMADLTALAMAGGGSVYPASQPETFAAALAARGAARLERQALRLLALADLGRWCVAFALLPVFLLFARRTE